MVPVTTRTGLSAALERTGGTVTHFLECLVGEGIDAQTHLHENIGAPSPNDFVVDEGEPLLQRSATLVGRTSHRSYVYAESLIVTSRMPPEFRHRLETGIDPIGRILDDMGIAVTREDLATPDGSPDGSIASRPWNTEADIGNCLLARTYRIDRGDTAIMVITEWFLATLTPFLPLA
jgi:chorismate-pyruvate lyase